MTTEMSVGRDDESFSNSFFNALLRVLTDASGSLWEAIDPQEADGSPNGAEPIRIMLDVAGSLRGKVLLEFPRAEANTLASALLRETVTEFGEEQQVALVTLVTSGASAFCAELQQEYGNVTINACAAIETMQDRANTVQRTASNEAGNHIAVCMYTDSLLMSQLSAHSVARSVAANAGILGKTGGTAGLAEQVNLDLVLDVELNVTLRFGKRQLTLREVLELTSGSVVELDRQVEEPVELLLDGILIARGEAVVIDGNYGLRVTEVSQPISSALLR
jgi:flagellar motor switch protein FliN/FliY